MRSRPHMLSMLAAAALVATPAFVGAQRMALPTPSIPALDLGGSSGKRGKHRNGGKGSPRRNWHSSNIGCGAKQCAKYARQAERTLDRGLPHPESHRLVARRRNGRIVWVRA